ncbi:MAG: galactose mutarotase [Bacteroidales bacterium]|nr:galactose mutarotase [Bacteroidales bacterium]
MKISKELFGKDKNGINVDLYSLENDNGMLIKITNYGGIITNIFHTDKKGNVDDLVLGFDDLSGYLGEHPYFGGIIGRFANRIAHAGFTLNGKEYVLAANNGGNHLHGGLVGFDKKIWQAETVSEKDVVYLHLTYLSEDMEEGYPGNLTTKVIYSLNNDNELKIEYYAETDKDTIINLTNHSYFNLNGGKKNILNHFLKMNCEFYTVVDEESIPTGEIRKVEKSPFDFREDKKIGDDWDKLENGYDHNYVVQMKARQLKWFAFLEDPDSGRSMEVATSLPGVQLYTSNYINNLPGKKGMIYNKQQAVCFETQYFPDSVNKPGFPSSVLKRGDVFHSTTIYRFNS